MANYNCIPVIKLISLISRPVIYKFSLLTSCRSSGWGIPNVQSMENPFRERNHSGTNVVREKYLIFSVSVDIRKEVVTGRVNSDT